MFKKICIYCCKASYSATEKGRWVCPHCHKDITDVDFSDGMIRRNKVEGSDKNGRGGMSS